MIIFTYSFDFEDGFTVTENEQVAIDWMRKEFEIPEDVAFLSDEWRSLALDGYEGAKGKSFQAMIVESAKVAGVRKWDCGL